MSLLDELQAIKGGYNGVNPDVVEDEGPEDAELVFNEHLDSRRWVEVWEAVFKRGDELVGLTYEIPATEMQEGGDFYHEFYPVEAYEETVVKYRQVHPEQV